MIDLIQSDFVERFLYKRIPVPHSDIGTGVYAAVGECLLERVRLLFGDAPEW